MHIGKMLAFTFCIIIVSFLFIVPVFAECDSCYAPNCSPCGCMVSEDGQTCVYPNYTSKYVYCGPTGSGVLSIPEMLPKVTKTIVLAIEVLVPVLLVVFGMFDLLKSIIAHKEDEIKKGQQILIKRLIVSAMIFSMVAIVKFVVSAFAEDNKNGMMNCVNCFVTGKCDSLEE